MVSKTGYIPSTKTFLDRVEPSDVPKTCFSRWKQRKDQVCNAIGACFSKAASLIPCCTQKRVGDPLAIRAAFQTNFFRRIGKDDRETMIRALEKQSHRQLSNSELTAFKEGNWSHKIFQDKNWMDLALLCYIRKDLNEMEISKLLLFDAVRELPGFKAHRIGNRGDFEVLRDGLKRFGLSKQLLQLRGLNSSDLQFFSFDLSFGEGYFNSGKQTMAAELYNHQNQLLITRGDDHRLKILILPPFLLYQINRLLFGDNASFPNVALGYDPDERIDNPKKRILCLPSRRTALPEFIHDCFFSEKLGMYLHDKVHLFVDSAITLRELWVDISENFQMGENVLGGMKFKEKLDDRFLSIYLQNFYEFGEPNPAVEKNDAMRFWLALGNLTYETNDDIVRQLLSYIFSKEKEYGSKYDISFNTLEAAFRKYPEYYDRVKRLFELATDLKQKESNSEI